MKTKAPSDITHGESARRQISASLVALAVKINQEHSAFEGMTNKVYKLALEIENRRIQIGIFLDTAKKECGHGKWMTWAKDNLPFSDDTARRFMIAARAANSATLRNLNELQEYNKVMVSWGLREPATLQDQTLHEFNPFQVFSQAVCKASGLVTKALEKRPVSEWPKDARDQAKELLKPLVEVYDQL